MFLKCEHHIHDSTALHNAMFKCIQSLQVACLMKLMHQYVHMLMQSKHDAAMQHAQQQNTEGGMLSGMTPKHITHSTHNWFTEFCKSQCLTHFTAIFINVWAEASIADDKCVFSNEVTTKDRQTCFTGQHDDNTACTHQSCQTLPSSF